MKPPYAVSLNDVSFSYGEGQGQGPSTRALDSVTLEIPTGQCVVLTGGSGCGKTTVTRLVNGLIPISYEGKLTGSITIAGTSSTAWEMDELCRYVGSVFQNPRSQFFNLDTTSEVAFGCENLGIPRDEIHYRVDDAFGILESGHLMDRDIHALSGGQRQMVAIASVYAMGPDVLVFDEPTASLDVVSMRQLASVIGSLKALGKTVIIAEHRLWWVADIADRVVVMKDGCVVMDCPSETFARLSDGERNAIGLRAWSVTGLKAKIGRCVGNASQSAVTVEGLHAAYHKGTEVLRGASVAFKEGSIVALIGRNGAGKTTLARCMVGLHKETAGSIRFGAIEPKCRKRPMHAYLVMQETGYQLFSDSVQGELKNALTHGGIKESSSIGEESVVEALERFGLTAFADRHPLSLSGGQRQRLAIAAGLLQGARVLVLDEPTSGLDYENMMRVAHELRRARDTGVCVVVITHDYEFIHDTCDSVAVISHGVMDETFDVEESSMGRIRQILRFDD